MSTGRPPAYKKPLFWSALALLLLGLNVAYFFSLMAANKGTNDMFLLRALPAVQALIAAVALLFGLLRLLGVGGAGGMRARLLGLLAMVVAVPPLYIGALSAAFGLGLGSGWGRPLRVRGRQVHPALREGSNWECGERPDPIGLDNATRAALEALWLHDAQKEHASVPAFARVSWLLAAVGALADLLRWSHRAAIEEIAHTRLCFAIAAGYGGRSHTVEPMPELLSAGLGLDGDAMTTLVGESLGDGCLLEDFNADIAAECAAVCEEPVTRRGLERIAREERSHAEFSWAVVTWLVQRDGDAVRAALVQATDGLAGYRRPTAVSAQKRALVLRADAAALRRHGRLPDERWAELWQQRLHCTEQRARALLATCELAAAGA